LAELVDATDLKFVPF